MLTCIMPRRGACTEETEPETETETEMEVERRRRQKTSSIPRKKTAASSSRPRKTAPSAPLPTPATQRSTAAAAAPDPQGTYATVAATAMTPEDYKRRQAVIAKLRFNRLGYNSSAGYRTATGESQNVEELPVRGWVVAGQVDLLTATILAQ
jgi:hypothetical protein